MAGKELVPRPAVPPPSPVAPPWPQDAPRRSEAVPVAAVRWARRNSHLSVPLAVPPAAWLTALSLHEAAPPGYVVPLSGALVSGAIWYFAPHKWDRGAEQWYARLSAALGSAWLWSAAALGPADGTVIPAVLGTTLTAGAGTWGFFWWRHKRPRGLRKRQKLIAQCDMWWQSHCHQWSLHGSRVTDAELRGVTLRMRIQGIGGRHAFQHFEQAVPLIESAAEGHADVGLVRVARVKGHPSQVDLFLKKENPLREAVEYDPEIAPQSVHDPWAFGRKETGEWKMASLRVNRFTNGMTRWGKSNDLLSAIASLSGCPDARLIVIDLKGGRSTRPVLQSGAAEYVVTDVDEARMVLRMTTAEARAREMYAYDGNEQLTATEAVPALFVMVDETHGLTATEDGAGDPECRRHTATLASQGSGVEMYVWIYTQHGSLESSVGTEQIRGNLAWRTCYRVAEARHGAYCIPEYAKLDASKLEEKGSCYVKDGPHATPEQIRTPLMEHAALTVIAGQNAALMGPRLPLVLYCGNQVAFETSDGPVTWQQWWDSRWLRLHEAFRADSLQYRAAVAAYSQDAGIAAAEAERHAAPSPGPGSGDAAVRDSATVPDDFVPDPGMVRRLPAALRSQEDRFADTLGSAAADSPVTPKDLMAASGFGSSWVHDRLAALQETGHVTLISRGRYAAVPGADIQRGLKEIKDRNERLNREARQMINAG